MQEVQLGISESVSTALCRTALVSPLPRPSEAVREPPGASGGLLVPGRGLRGSSKQTSENPLYAKFAEAPVQTAQDRPGVYPLWGIIGFLCPNCEASVLYIRRPLCVGPVRWLGSEGLPVRKVGENVLSDGPGYPGMLAEQLAILF